MLYHKFHISRENGTNTLCGAQHTGIIEEHQERPETVLEIQNEDGYLSSEWLLESEFKFTPNNS